MDASPVALGWVVALFVFLVWLWNSLNIIKEWERGAVLRLGRMTPEAKGAGLRIVVWPIETLYRIPLRVVTLDVPPQDIITRDNVSVKVNAVCYFKVVDANRALREVENYLYATIELRRPPNVWLFGPDGEASRELTFNGGSQPRWNRDGRSLVVHVNDGVARVAVDDVRGRRRSINRQPDSGSVD